MNISTLRNNLLSLSNELHLVNTTATPETYQTMLHEVLEKRGLVEALGHVTQG